jgi:Casjensviridae DNA polymerase
MKKLVVCDLSSIETRVTAWVSGCASLLRVFEEGRDPYIEFATKMYGVPYDQVTKEQRQISKPPVLGCGYGLGAGEESVDKNGDEIKTGLWGYGENMGISMTQEQAQLGVRIYRETYSEVCHAWRKLEKAAVMAVQTGLLHTTCGLTFGCVGNKLLHVALPSGRRLHYIRPRLDSENKLSYDGQIIGAHWGRVWTWGGKIMENVVQAISRDILAVGMLRATEVGFSIVGHSHDEMVCEEETLDLEQLRDCMIRPIEWALGLPLDAEGWEGDRYRK